MWQRKTWTTHGTRLKVIKEGVAAEDKFVILEPAVRFGDADRWPCGIIFSLA